MKKRTNEELIKELKEELLETKKDYEEAREEIKELKRIETDKEIITRQSEEIVDLEKALAVKEYKQKKAGGGK